MILEIRQRWPQRGEVTSRIVTTLTHPAPDGFLCVGAHVRRPCACWAACLWEAVTAAEPGNGRKDDQRWCEVPTQRGLLLGQDESPFHQLAPRQSLWSQSSSRRLRWKQSWPFPALRAAGYGLLKGCEPRLGITFLWFLLFSLVVEWFNQRSAASDLWNLYFFSSSCSFPSHPCWFSSQQMGLSREGSLLYPLMDSFDSRCSLTATST